MKQWIRWDVCGLIQFVYGKINNAVQLIVQI